MSNSLLNQSQTFVEKAQVEAESAPVRAGDPEAGKLLEQARQHIYFWPREFEGFTCGLRIEGQGGPWRARLQAPSSRRFSLEDVQGGPELRSWAHYQVGEILGHREHPSHTRMASKSGVTFGDYDPVYGQRIDFAGDKMSSFYRIQANKISQIGRTYGGQSFVICIDRHLEIQGRFVATNYTAFYSTPEGALAKVEAYQDDYVCLRPDLWLPWQRRFSVAQESQREHRVLHFEAHQLFGHDER